MPAPEDPILTSADECAWAVTSEDDYGCEGSVVAADRMSRGAARARYAQYMETDLVFVGAWKRYARPFTRQEAWDAWGRDEFEWEDAPSLTVSGGKDYPEPPRRVPDDWDPGYDVERWPTWEFVPRGTPGAWAIWCCGPQRDGAPPSPTSGRKQSPHA